MGKRIGWILEEQPSGISEGARRIERRMAQLVEPVGRRREHWAMIARGSRGSAEFTDRHRTAPGPVVHCSSLFFFHHSVNIPQEVSAPLKWGFRADPVSLTGH